MFAFTLKDEIDNYTVFDVSNALRERGWRCPPTRSPRTARTSRRCASSSGAASRHDLADLLVDDLKRQLPRLEQQAAPVHDSSSAAGFHH